MEGNKNFNEVVLSGYNIEICNIGVVVNFGYDIVGVVVMDFFGRLVCVIFIG